MQSRLSFINGIAFLSLLMAVGCAPNPNLESVNPNADTSAIIGGREVPNGDPLQTSIVAIRNFREGFLCSGSLLPNNIVLTAAHCIHGSPKDYLIIFNSNSDIKSMNKDEARSRARLVSQIYAHPDFGKMTAAQEAANPNGWTSDLGLIKFEGTIPDGYAPATFATPATSAANDFARPGTQIVVAGYGGDSDKLVPVPVQDTQEFKNAVQSGQVFCMDDAKTHQKNCFTEDATGSGKLRTTTLQIIGRPNPFEVQILQDKGSSICMGDSGGPAYIVGPGNKLLLFGVASRVSRGCNDWGIYTDATSQLKWLNQTIAGMLAASAPPSPQMPQQPVRPLPQQPGPQPFLGQQLPGQQQFPGQQPAPGPAPQPFPGQQQVPPAAKPKVTMPKPGALSPGQPGQPGPVAPPLVTPPAKPVPAPPAPAPQAKPVPAPTVPRMPLVPRTSAPPAPQVAPVPAPPRASAPRVSPVLPRSLLPSLPAPFRRR